MTIPRTTKTIDAPALRRATLHDAGLEIRVDSYDEAANTIEVCWTTGATVRRFDWRNDQYYDEELVVSQNAIRLERLNSGAPLLNSHGTWDLRRILGAVVKGSVRIQGGKGYALVRLSQAEDVRPEIQRIREGSAPNISVGYRIHRVEKIENGEGAIATWRVVDWEPYEISSVTIPADAGAQVRTDPAVETNPCVLVGEADERTEEPATTTTRAASRAANQKAPHMADDIETADEEVPRNATLKERRRAAKIGELADQFGMREFGAEHLNAGTSVDHFRTLILDKLVDKQEREGGPVAGRHILGQSARATVAGATDAERRADAATTALLHRSSPAQFTMTEGAREFAGLTLMEMARDFLEAHGVSTRGMSKNEIAERALAAGIRAGGMMSTSDFPMILANVANKTLRAAYEAAPQTWRPLVRVTTTPDFKEVTRAQLGEAPAFEKVREGGEFKRGSIGEAAEKYKVETYGKVVAITRQAIINDDLDAFTRLPRAFGVQAASLESDLVWSQITSNPVMGDGTTLFHAAHKNIGTAAPISVDSVGAGRKMMSMQTGLDGKTRLNISPAYIVVPRNAELVAEKLITDITPAKTADVVPASIRKLQVISDPRLDDASPFNWYLATDGSLVDLIELAYLEGNQGVYTETRTGFDVDGVEVKVRLDVGAKVIDWRGLHKNPATSL